MIRNHLRALLMKSPLVRKLEDGSISVKHLSVKLSELADNGTAETARASLKAHIDGKSTRIEWKTLDLFSRLLGQLPLEYVPDDQPAIPHGATYVFFPTIWEAKVREAFSMGLLSPIRRDELLTTRVQVYDLVNLCQILRINADTFFGWQPPKE